MRDALNKEVQEVQSKDKIDDYVNRVSKKVNARYEMVEVHIYGRKKWPLNMPREAIK